MPGSRGFASEQEQTAFFAAYDALMARWPVPFEAIDLASAYGTTRINACGPAEGRPLVLLHGGGATSAVWFANVGDLSRRHRVYAIDLMGHAGRSVHDGQPIRTAEDLFGWLDGVLEQLGVTGAWLVGHSYGAWIALDHALRAAARSTPTSRRIAGLVLLDPTKCFTGQRPAYLLHATPLMLRPSPERSRAFLAWEAGGLDRLDPLWLELAGRATTFPASRLVLPTRPAAERLRALDLPTLVVAAEHSLQHDSARLAAGARRLLPRVTVVTVPDVSHHTMPFRQAERIDREIVDVVSGAGG